jgi:hypothetical protein
MDTWHIEVHLHGKVSTYTATDTLEGILTRLANYLNNNQ